jgi:hypothetical protein
MSAPLSVLLDVDADVFETLFAEQYKGKERLLASNIQALHLGRNFVQEHLPYPLGIRVRRSDMVGDQIFTDGNSAAALGCIYGGATVAAWYPDHAFVIGARGVSEVLRQIPGRSCDGSALFTRSFRRRTNWLRSAWSWVPVGTRACVHGHIGAGASR